MNKPDRCRLRFAGGCKDGMHHYSEALRKGLVRWGHTGYRKKSFANKGSLQVNRPLGLTFYCSDMAFKTRAAHLVVTASVAAVLVISVAGAPNRSRRFRASGPQKRPALFPGLRRSSLGTGARPYRTRRPRNRPAGAQSAAQAEMATSG